MSSTPALAPGSWILVTGANGYLASHIVSQFLSRGYKVRGTVRDPSSVPWLAGDLFATYAAAGSFELVSVPDLGAPDAFDAVVAGMNAVIHVATVATFDPDPDKVVAPTVAATRNLLRLAKAAGTVTRFVYTSTFGTTGALAPGRGGGEMRVISQHSWNDDAAPPGDPNDPRRGLMNYVASKLHSEKEVLRFARDEDAGFVVNVVSPVTVFGETLHKEQDGRSTVAWLKGLFRGETTMVDMMPASWYVHPADVATLHVAAVLDDSLSDLRLQAWASPFNWNDVLAVYRAHWPGRGFHADFENLPRLNISTDDAELTKALIAKWGSEGQEDWIPFEEGVVAGLKREYPPEV